MQRLCVCVFERKRERERGYGDVRQKGREEKREIRGAVAINLCIVCVCVFGWRVCGVLNVCVWLYESV